MDVRRLVLFAVNHASGTSCSYCTFYRSDNLLVAGISLQYTSTGSTDPVFDKIATASASHQSKKLVSLPPWHTVQEASFVCCGLEPAWWSRTNSALASSVPLSSTPSMLAAMSAHWLELSPPWSRYVVANSILVSTGRLTFTSVSIFLHCLDDVLSTTAGSGCKHEGVHPVRPAATDGTSRTRQAPGQPRGGPCRVPQCLFCIPQQAGHTGALHCYETTLHSTALLSQCQMQQCFLAFPQNC